MTSFLEKVEPCLLSEDSFVQHFAVRALRETYLATPDTLFTAFEAFDKGNRTIFPSSILPHVDFVPIDARGCEELINRIKKNDDNQVFYLRMVSNASTDLLLAYKDQLKSFMNVEYLETLQEMKNLDEEGLFTELGEITNRLESENKHRYDLFSLGKRVIRELLDRDNIPTWEVENGIRYNLQADDYMNYDGIYNVFMAGELRVESVLPELIQILDKDEGDFVLEEAMKALIKIGTDNVVAEVEKVALNGDTFYHAIDILAKIKTKKAEEALLRLFDQATDITTITLIADALCQHLSVDAIPKIEKLLETGYDNMMLNLEESLYGLLMINEIDHPYLLEMRHNLEEEQRRLNERKSMLDMLNIPVDTVKVGRNDPCPCGSGKKHKKCCLK
jgi:hypothetical protein